MLRYGNTRLEVGQALLQRHEAYVRRHPRIDEDKTRLENEVDELRSQNASLEKVNICDLRLTLLTLNPSGSGSRGCWLIMKCLKPQIKSYSRNFKTPDRTLAVSPPSTLNVLASSPVWHVSRWRKKISSKRGIVQTRELVWLKPGAYLYVTGCQGYKNNLPRCTGSWINTETTGWSCPRRFRKELGCNWMPGSGQRQVPPLS